MNAAHMHLLVNHLPIVGFAIGTVLLVATLIRGGDRGMFLASTLVIVMSGAGALAAPLTGEPAEEIVERLPDMPDSLIETHEDAAKIATIIATITTGLAIAVSIVSIRRDGNIASVALYLVLLATTSTCVAMAWTGSTGGKIRHSEIRGL